MSDYIGVISLKNSIPCKKDVSGKRIKTKIAGHDVLIVFPSIPDDYDAKSGPNFEKGDLVVPGNLFKEKVNWGMVNAWPQGLFSVNNLLVYVSGKDDDIHEIYSDFPRWREKLNNLLLIDTGDYMIPKQKLPALLVGGGINDGLQVFEAVKSQPLRYVRNSRTTDPIQVRFVESKEAYALDEITELFTNVGNSKEIALTYELLIMAYRAMERHDFRSAVILGGSALEQAIINRMRREYPSNTKFKHAKDSKQHTMLKGRFNWLIEKNVSIPVADYQKTIIKVRNDAAHDGIRPSYAQTKQCLENCKMLIETYHPNVLEQ